MSIGNTYLITSHNRNLNRVTAGVDCTTIYFVSRFPQLLMPDIWFFDYLLHPPNNLSLSIHLLTFIYSPNYYLKISYCIGEPILHVLRISGKYNCKIIAYLSCRCNAFSYQNKLDFNWSTVTLYLGYNINRAI